ncbi:MAG: DUF1704 domain-containing protein, partial [Spirochaetota bacterium]|nr:DUF1704 domain-containing protein [Spirochaetota bacterium]
MQKLPGGIKIHIDRKLPFLILYRSRGDYRDKAAVRLFRSEASYCIFQNQSDSSRDIKIILQPIIAYLTDDFGSFLIIEITLSKDESSIAENEIPSFKIFSSHTNTPEVVIDTLEKELKKYRHNKIEPEVSILNMDHKENDSSFINKAFNELECFVIGIEVSPFFIDKETGDIYPLLIRRLARFLSRALRRSIYQFIQNYTSQRPGNYQSLGKRSFVKAVWDIDKRIAHIGSLFDPLFLITPYNVDEAWQKFIKSGFSQKPVFRYRPLPVEPARLKRDLFKIDLDVIEDPVLFRIFSEKQIELDRQISMLQDRGTKKFLYGSLQVYGELTNSLYELSRDLLQKFSVSEKENTGKKYCNATQISTIVQNELEYYRKLNPEIKAKVFIKDDIAGILVSQGDLYIGSNTKVKKSRIKSLMSHEVGTHIITYYNALAQPFMLIRSGFAGYEELQEGIAILSELLTGGLTTERLRTLAARVITAKMMKEGAEFIDAFRHLNEEYGFSTYSAFMISMRIFRSGGFTKDIIYMKGFIKLLDYLAHSERLEHLFYGKVSLEQLP